jgi:hypothetical protein
MDDDYFNAACCVPNVITDWFNHNATRKHLHNPPSISSTPSKSSSHYPTFARQLPISTEEVLKLLPNIYVPPQAVLYQLGRHSDTEWAKGARSITNLHGQTPLPLWILGACKAFQMSIVNLEGLEESLEWLEEKWLEVLEEVQFEFEDSVKGAHHILELLDDHVILRPDLGSNGVLQFLSDKWIDSQLMDAITKMLQASLPSHTSSWIGSTAIQFGLELSENAWGAYNTHNQLSTL